MFPCNTPAGKVETEDPWGSLVSQSSLFGDVQVPVRDGFGGTTLEADL